MISTTTVQNISTHTFTTPRANGHRQHRFTLHSIFREPGGHINQGSFFTQAWTPPKYLRNLFCLRRGIMNLISTLQSIRSYHSYFKPFISSILRPKHLYSHQSDKYPLIHTMLQLFHLHTQQHRYDTILYCILYRPTHQQIVRRLHVYCRRQHICYRGWFFFFIISFYSTTIDTIV